MAPASKNPKSFKSRIKKWQLGLVAFFLIIILIALGLVSGYQQVYAQKFFPGVKIANFSVGGQNQKQILNQLKTIEDNLRDKGIQFIYKDKEVTVTPIIISATDPDLTQPVLTFDWQKTVEEAFQVGRQGDWTQRLFEQLTTLIFSRQLEASYYLNKERVLEIIKANFSDLEKPPLDAQLKITEGKVEVLGERSGYIFNYDKAGSNLEENILALNFQPITLDLIFQEPKIKKQYTGSAVNSLENILKAESLTLKADSRSWRINKEQFIPWLEFQAVGNEILVGLSKQEVDKFLESVAKEINIAAQDAKFELKDGRVVEFQVSRDGKALNISESYKKINERVSKGQNGEIELVVEISPAKVATSEVNDLGIKELIGKGISNFAGSPKNRRHNIAVGAKALNGILIKPGEEFSLLKALGAVDAAHGYKQELVIKGDRTIPEFGGGLCQIGTTTFRAALNAGLPITQRQAHSYRVIYYEPAGMDATIYDPYPDFRFINDTGYYILFTTRIEGDDLIFEFYGTKDGRKVVIEPNPPKLYNVTSPGEPKYIETDELKPGEKKKIETAHKGGEAYFKYTIIYPNGEVKEKEFYSRYVAWPEVWLVGKQPSATTTDILSEEKPESG